MEPLCRQDPPPFGAAGRQTQCWGRLVRRFLRSHRTPPCGPTCCRRRCPRSIKLTNPKIQSLVVEVPGALDALKALGWAHDEADAELLTIQAGKYM